MNKRIHVGTYQLGFQNVDLFVLPHDTGGEFFLCPDTHSPPRIIIGLNYPSWPECLAILLHETIELTLCTQNHRFQRSGKLSGDLADFTFILDHSQFSQVIAIASTFLSNSIPELAAHYQKYSQPHCKRNNKKTEKERPPSKKEPAPALDPLRPRTNAQKKKKKKTSDHCHQ